MENKINNEAIMTSLPRLAVLLCAIMPVTENTDWLFYTCFILAVLSFLIFVTYSIIVCTKDHKKILDIFGTSHDSLYDIFIAMTGIIISYSLGLSHRAYLWWFWLIASLFEIFFPNKKLEM